MTDAILRLSPEILTAIADRLRGMADDDPWPRLLLQTIAGQKVAVDDLENLRGTGVSPRGLAAVCDTAAAANRRAGDAFDRSQLVLSGPEAEGVPTRATEAVVAELIESARRSIVFVTYSIWDGKTLFARLAERMTADHSLSVRLFLNIERPRHDTSTCDDIVARFKDNFLRRHWPTSACLPEVFYDPRALDPSPALSGRLHAKCIIVDSARLLVTSANLSDAAQTRNIEMGMLTEDVAIVKRAVDYFGGLAANGALEPLFRSVGE